MKEVKNSDDRSEMYTKSCILCADFLRKHQPLRSKFSVFGYKFVLRRNQNTFLCVLLKVFIRSFSFRLRSSILITHSLTPCFLAFLSFVKNSSHSEFWNLAKFSTRFRNQKFRCELNYRPLNVNTNDKLNSKLGRQKVL